MKTLTILLIMSTSCMESAQELPRTQSDMVAIVPPTLTVPHTQSSPAVMQPSRHESFSDRIDHAELDYDVCTSCCCRVASGAFTILGVVTGFASAVLAGITIDQSIEPYIRVNLSIAACVMAAASGLVSALQPAIDKMIRDKGDRIGVLEQRISDHEK